MIILVNQTKDQSEEALLSKHAVEIVRDLQRLDGMEGDYEEDSGTGPGRRKTITNIEKSRKKTQAINTLDVAFRQRFFSMSEEGNGAFIYTSIYIYIYLFIFKKSFII